MKKEKKVHINLIFTLITENIFINSIFMKISLYFSKFIYIIFHISRGADDEYACNNP